MNELWGINPPTSSGKNKGKGKPFSYADAAKANVNSGPFTFNFTPNSRPWNKNNVKPSAASALSNNNQPSIHEARITKIEQLLYNLADQVSKLTNKLANIEQQQT